MQPLQRPTHAQPGFIGMGQGTRHEPLSDRRHRRAQSHRSLAPHGVERGRRERDPGQRPEQLGGALVGQLLVVGQVHRDGRHPRTVLHRRLDTPRPGAAMNLPAGAQAPDRPILGDLAPDHQIGELASLGQFLDGEC